MKKASCIVLLSGQAAFLFCGCATTGDPHADTLFWSRAKAERRQAAQRSELEVEKQRVESLEAQRVELQLAQKRINTETAELASILAILRFETERLNEARKNTSIDRTEVARLDGMMKSLETKVTATTKAGELATAAAQARIAVLREECQRLQRAVSALVKVQVEEPKVGTRPPVGGL